MEGTAVANNIWRTACQVTPFDDIPDGRFFAINNEENSNQNIDYLNIIPPMDHIIIQKFCVQISGLGSR